MAYGQHKDIDSFFHLIGADIQTMYCRCLACFVAKELGLKKYKKALEQEEAVYNLGRAYASPEAGSDQARPYIKARAPKSIVLERIINKTAHTLAGYRATGGYFALKKALAMTPEEIISEIELSGLRGRGGAGFYTGKKWRMALAQSSLKKYVVVNGDEGDAGAYIDRFILEDDPFTIIEAATIAGFALGANHGVIYIRKEYPEAQKSINNALKTARNEGLLGQKIFGSAFDFDLEMIGGHGSYLCGEESALLNAIEKKRPEVRARPPYPSEVGLFKAPTLINNVETMANIPWIISHGSGAYNSLGFSKSRGTKCISLNSLFRRPGLYEVEFGVSVRHIVEDIGGGLKLGKLKGLLIGGPLAGIIPPELLDIPFGFEELSAIGASVGHGGVIAFNHDVSIAGLMQHVFEFGAFESCGKCTPCRVGSREVEVHFHKVLAKEETTKKAQNIDGILDALKYTSLCAHGSGLADFARSIKRYYGEEYLKCFP